MKVTIVGAGPIGCLAAIRFCSRGHDVSIYEQRPDWRQHTSTRGKSFNLTLSSRGLDNLDEELRQDLYRVGVPMRHRVVHHDDGRVSQQPYGIDSKHHILSIPRLTLGSLLLDRAQTAGAEVHFEQRCIAVNTRTADTQLFSANTGLQSEHADIVLGCDGANSLVRHEISKRSPHIKVEQLPSPHGYIELNMPPELGGIFTEMTSSKATEDATTSGSAGLHIWPRNDSLLIAQPNLDSSFTTTLFAPRSYDASLGACLEDLNKSGEIEDYMSKTFPDVVEFLPSLHDDIHRCSSIPSLKTISMNKYHHGKAVLLGDAAHAMLPFFGQGTNCGFEDVSVLFQILDEAQKNDLPIEMEDVCCAYSSKRVADCNAISELSSVNLDILAKKADDPHYQNRQDIERTLFLEHPEEFTPLYCAIAFTSIPYRQALDDSRKSEAILDDLCSIHDAASEKQTIVKEYLDRATNDYEHVLGRGDGLEVSIDEAADLISNAGQRLMKYFGDLQKDTIPASYVYDSNNVSLYRNGKEVARSLREDELPRKSQSIDSLLDAIFDTAITNGTVHNHPGFMAHVPSGGLFQSAVGEFISRSLNRFIGVWLATPGFVEIESNVIRWFCEILGYDKNSFGYLTTGGSLANFMGILCAKERLHTVPLAKMRLYTSHESHYSVSKAAKMAGLTDPQIRLVDVDATHKMDVEHLKHLVDTDRNCDLVPFCVVATAGTTNTGAIDDLDTISKLCNSENTWLHIDACFGGFFCLTSRGRSAMKGIEFADSISVDAHKGLFLPHGNAALLVKNRTELRATFEMPNSAYMPGFSQDPDLVDFCNYGPELSRETRGLSAWLPIKSRGLDAFERCLDGRMDLANRLAKGLSLIEGIEVLPRPSCLPVVVFRLKKRPGVDGDNLNRDLCESICRQKNVYLTTTTIPEVGVVNRVCILHSSTTEYEIEQCLSDVEIALKMTVPMVDRSPIRVDGSETRVTPEHSKEQTG